MAGSPNQDHSDPSYGRLLRDSHLDLEIETLKVNSRVTSTFDRDNTSDNRGHQFKEVFRLSTFANTTTKVNDQALICLSLISSET